MTRHIYLDYQSTTPVDPRVLKAMLPYFEERFGNASSVQHGFGLEAAEAVEAARTRLAALIGSDRREVFFLSGATEANNLALKGLASGATQRRHIVALATEHRAVLDPLRVLRQSNFLVTLLGVDAEGQPDLEELESVVDDRTLLISAAAANNEIGTLPPLREIAAIAHSHGALLHTDAAQAVGKIKLDVERDGIDLLSVSGHKLYGPKGVGALYVRREHQGRLTPAVDGGGQEGGLRSGTVNVPGIVGLGAAAQIACDELAAEAPRLTRLRERFCLGLRNALEDVEPNGPLTHRLPGNLNLRFPGVDAEALIANCPQLAFSAGSACSSATPTPSHVLLAIGRSHEEAEQCARFGFGRPTTSDEIDEAVDQLTTAVKRIRSAMGFPQPIGAA